MMDDALPSGIVARVQRLGVELVTLARHLRNAPLAEQEQAVLLTIRRALPDVLTAVIEASTQALDDGVVRVRHRCPRCGGRVRVHGWRARRVQTVCGTITVQRPWYACRPCGHGFSPVDRTLELAERTRMSAGLRAWVVRLGAATTFRDAVAVLDDLTGLRVAPETVRQSSEACGTILQRHQDAAITQVLNTHTAAEPVQAAPGTLIVEADGVMIRYRDGWHEVKIGVIGGTTPQGTMTAASYIAAREEAAHFGPRLLTEAARRGALDIVGWTGPLQGRGLALLRPVHVVADGAPWIWNLAADHFGTRTEVVDFYHASQHLWAVARALFGEDTAEATAWARARVGELYDQGSPPVRAALTAARAPTPTAAELVRVERGYFATNASRMDYPTIRDRRLPIGSGAVESSTKHLVQHRMKRPGQRWSDHGGRAMLALRATLASDRPLHPDPKHHH